MWWRTFFLQAAFSYARKQNLGLAAIYRRLRPDTAIPTEVLLEPFNTHPVASAFVLPFLALQEGAGADLGRFRDARAALASSFAAVCDRLFWYLLRPVAGLLGLSILGLTRIPNREWVAAGVMLVAYNGPQCFARARLWSQGRRGESPVRVARELSGASEVVRRAGLVILGLAAAVAALPASASRLGLIPLLAGVAFGWFGLRRWPQAATWLALAGALLAGVLEFLLTKA